MKRVLPMDPTAASPSAASPSVPPPESPLAVNSTQPILSSTPRPSEDSSVIPPTPITTPTLPPTQYFVDRLDHLRDVKKDDRRGAQAQPPVVIPLSSRRLESEIDEETDNDDEKIDAIAVRRENETLKSEITALKLLLEDAKEEISRLQRIPTQPQLSEPELEPVLTRSKKRRMKKRARLAALIAAAAAATEAAATAAAITDAATSTASQQHPLPPQQHPPQQLLHAQQPQQPPPQTIHLFHDSNCDDKFLTKQHIQNAIDTVNKKIHKTTTTYNITKHATYELQQTLNQIRRINLTKNDIVLLNIMTNDARSTRKRPPKSLRQTEMLLTSIYDLLLSILPPANIVLIESPPHKGRRLNDTCK